MIAIKDLGKIQDLDHEQLTRIVGGATNETETSQSITYIPDVFKPCPLYLFPNGTIGHLCPDEPKPPTPPDPIFL